MFVVLMLSVFNHYTAKMTAAMATSWVAMVTSWVTFHMIYMVYIRAITNIMFAQIFFRILLLRCEVVQLTFSNCYLVLYECLVHLYY